MYEIYVGNDLLAAIWGIDEAMRYIDINGLTIIDEVEDVATQFVCEYIDQEAHNED